MTQLNLDVVKEWLAGFRNNGKTPEPRKAIYQDKEVYIHNETLYYVIVSYTSEPQQMFAVPLTELK